LINTITLNGNAVSVVSVPDSPGLASLEPSVTDTVATVASPFTGQTQTQEWPGADMVAFTCTLPPLTLPQADDWISFLMQCRGMRNAFLMGDPTKRMPRGTGLGTPVVNLTPFVQNYLLFSGSFTNAAWSPNQIASITDNAVAAPDGSLTASSMVAVVNPTDAFITQGATVPVGATITYSVYLKASGTPPSKPVQIQVIDGGVVGSNTITICPLSSVWKRFTVTHTAQNGSIVVFVGCNTSVSDPNESFDVAWAQVELGSEASPYVATQAAQATLNTNTSMAQSFYTRGWKPNSFGLLVAGDYLQHGQRLHRVLDRVNSDSSGNAVISVSPSIREAPLDGDPIILRNPKGLFRLATNKRQWSVDYTFLTRMSFMIQEYR
jgi:hypothetical protein